MSASINQIRLWAAAELRYWEQAALNLILSGVEVSEEQVAQLITYFMQDCGLAAIPSDRPKHLATPSLTTAAKSSPSSLVRIFDFQNVNALPPGQELRFGSQLTIIYGENGAGKTGYVRPLAAAGFARGERQVLPDATKPDTKTPPSAEIEISWGDALKTISWTSGKHCPELSGFYIFDGESVVAHLTRSNSLSFSPGGLVALTRLAELTDLVRERIKTVIEEREKAHDFLPLFGGDSKVRQHILNLGLMTDLQALEQLANLSEDEQSQLLTLDREIAELKLRDIPRQIAKRRQELGDLENLIESVKAAQRALGDSVETEIISLVREVERANAELERSGVSQFTTDLFTHVGTPDWLRFVAAAKVLAETEAEQGRLYPTTGAPCLLCRQPLSLDAASLLERLWEFLKSDAKSKLEEAQNACVNRAKQIEGLALNYFGHDSNARRLIQAELEIIMPALEAQIEACVERRKAFAESLRSYAYSQAPPLVGLQLNDLEQLAEVRRREIIALGKSDVGQQLRSAENSFREFKHRQTLADNLRRIKQYVEGRRWAAQARQSLGSTRTVTTKYNELFKELVTDRYVSLFENFLGRFAKNMRVGIETRGSKGETVRQLVLKTDSGSRPYSVSQVLSDGEKRAVAISDFLAEITLDQNCTGIILDDPVTSLDDRWKDTIAQCLVEQAKLRQVIIFTHDLAFLYRIKAHSDELEVEAATHWIKDEGGRPGFIYQNNSPVCENDYKSSQRAQELYGKSKQLAPEEQQGVLQQGFGALRTSYEALIMFELFNGVVQRFEERISFPALEKVRIDKDVVDDIIKHMGKLSRYIDAHLHSDKFASVKPTPNDLLEEINAFDAIRKKQKEIKQSI